MQLKGKYLLTYHIDKEIKELTVDVELLLVDGFKQPFQNLYCGNVIINSVPNDSYNLSYCVDAKLAAERIGMEQKEKLINKFQKENIKFKIKKEEIK